MEATTDLIIPLPTDAVALFTGPDGIEKILADIKAEVAKYSPDATTAAGRKEIGSLALKVSKSKVRLDDLGKELVSEWKTQSAKVDASRKIARDTLDALRDEVLAPKVKWEEQEAAEMEKARLAAKIIADEEAAYADHAIFLEREELRAIKAKIAADEAARVAKEEEARADAAQKENEERIRREAEEKAKQEAEARVLAAEEAAKQSEHARIAAEAKAQAEKEAAVAAAEQRARDEAARLEQERKHKEALREAEAEAQRKEDERKSADFEHRRKINSEAVASLVAMDLTEQQAKSFVKAIIQGAIKHVTINY